MRFAFLSLLSAALYLSPASVSADCHAATSDRPTAGQTPNLGALTMFVTSNTRTGAIQAAGGLTAADKFCTTTAAASALAKATYNRDAGGNTVQFTALLSTSTVDAYDRLLPALPIKYFKNPPANSNPTLTSFDCAAVDRNELFIGFDGQGMQLDTEINDESGNTLGGDTVVWTGTGVPTEATPDVSAAEATALNYGGKYFRAGSVDKTPIPDSYYCGDWTKNQAKASTGIFRATQPSNAADQNTWLQQAQTPELNCDQQFRLICISSQAYNGPTPPGFSGDPQFMGLQGQSFQVHGMPEEYFNLITSPTFQLNSRFTYLASGNCNYNNTECWTHPGTYVDQLGFMFPGLNIKVVAGPHHKGLRVWVNDEEMHKSAGRLVMTTTTGMNATNAAEVIVSHHHHDLLTVSFPMFTFTVTNSDWFFNFNVAFHAQDILSSGRAMHFIQDSRGSTKSATAHYLPEGHNTVYPSYPLHGLVGQTWKNARYAGKRMYQGEVDDYMMLDHELFSTSFVYNLYQYQGSN